VSILLCRADLGVGGMESGRGLHVGCAVAVLDWCDAIGSRSMLSVPSQCVSLLDMSRGIMAPVRRSQRRDTRGVYSTALNSCRALERVQRAATAPRVAMQERFGCRARFDWVLAGRDHCQSVLACRRRLGRD
jgi:hypothetical protein